MSTYERNVSVREAALKMGKTPSFVRVALQQGKLPFGTAVKLSTKWTYYINPVQFKQYLGETESNTAQQAQK